MSSIMLAADTAAIEDRCVKTVTRHGSTAQRRASLPRQAQGLAAGILFLAAWLPGYLAVLLFGALASAVGAALYIIQAIGLRLTRPAGAVAAAALALLCIGDPQRARADMVNDTSLLKQTTVVFSQQTNLYAFDAPSAGTLSITLKDWGFPVTLQELNASILFHDQVLGSWDSSKDSDWSFDVPIASGGVFDAFVAAQAGTFLPGFQLGAYSMSITFEATPVPLPPALDLLLGGMALLAAVTLVERISRRRNRDVISVA